MQSSHPNFNFIAGELLLVDKPKTWTSFDVVNKLRYAIRRQTGKKKIKVGHAGTLDPLATGLLLICTGKRTKTINELQGLDKEYTGTITLGAATPSFDAETAPSATFDYAHLTEAQILATVPPFLGEQQQVPPTYSAIKVDGVALYKKARKGQVITPKARTVYIHSFELTRIALPEVDFCISCSKGTYIRSIAHDFGKALQNGGYLTALRRTRIGNFHLSDAWQLDDLVQFIQAMPPLLVP